MQIIVPRVLKSGTASTKYTKYTIKAILGNEGLRLLNQSEGKNKIGRVMIADIAVATYPGNLSSRTRKGKRSD